MLADAAGAAGATRTEAARLAVFGCIVPVIAGLTFPLARTCGGADGIAYGAAFTCTFTRDARVGIARPTIAALCAATGRAVVAATALATTAITATAVTTATVA